AGAAGGETYAAHAEARLASPNCAGVCVGALASAATPLGHKLVYNSCARAPIGAAASGCVAAANGCWLVLCKSLQISACATAGAATPLAVQAIIANASEKKNIFMGVLISAAGRWWRRRRPAMRLSPLVLG